MRIMGMNETIMMAGDLRPMPATAVTRPSVTARLYAGAVEAMPITMLESMPTAFALSPLSTSIGTTPPDPPVPPGSPPRTGTEGSTVAIVPSTSKHPKDGDNAQSSRLDNARNTPVAP